MRNLAAVCFTLLLAAARLAASETRLPQDPNGGVSLSWEKFSEIWDKMQSLEKQIEQLNQTTTPPPPVAYTLTRAAYAGRVGEKTVDMDAAFEIDVYDKAWVKVPFFPADVAVRDARLDGKPVGVIQENGWHHVLLRAPGRHALAVSFVVKAPGADDAPRFSFPIAQTPITLLALTFPRPGLDVTVDPAQGAAHSGDGRGTRVTAVIPTTGQISVRWQKVVAREKPLPSKLYVESQALYTVSEAALRGQWTFFYNVLHQGVRELAIKVPTGWNVLAVSADGLEDWTPVTQEDVTLVTLRFDAARKGALPVTLIAERGLAADQTTVEIQRPVPQGVERESGVVAIEAKGAVEVEIPEQENLTAMDPQELPAALWQKTGQPVLQAFRHTRPYALAVSITRHPEVAVLTTTVDMANGLTLFTGRGGAVTRVTYQVRNHLKQYLTITLPEGAELWSAFVNGEPVKPTQSEKHVYRLPLARSLNMGDSAFPVEIIYHAKTPRLGLFGHRSTPFPVPDAPVSRLMWSVYLPDSLRVLRFGGDVEKGGLASGFAPVLGRAVMEASSFDAPAIDERQEQVYRRDAKSLAKKMNLLSGLAGAKEADALVDMQGALAQSIAPASVRQGVFPIAFDIPAAGQLFTFGRTMVVNETPRLTCLFVDAVLVQAFAAFLLGFVFFGFYRRRDEIIALLRRAAGALEQAVRRLAALRRSQIPS